MARSWAGGRTFQMKAVTNARNAVKRLKKAFESAKKHEFIDVDVYVDVPTETSAAVQSELNSQLSTGFIPRFSGPFIDKAVVFASDGPVELVLPR